MLTIRRYGVTVAVAAAVAVVLSACSGTASDGGADVPASPAAPAPDETTPESPPASSSPDATGEGAAAGNAEVLAFSAPDLEGGTLDASQYAGRDVILWMWAPW